MRRLLVPAALCTVFSCSDSSGPNLPGTMTFTFTGGGTFLAAGNAPSVNANPPTATAWAVGFVDGGELHVGASRPRSGGLVDLAIVRIERTTLGSESFDSSCNIDGLVPCTGMDFYLNFNGSGDTGDYFCVLTTGSVAITEISASRAKGTFSGTGSCLAGAGGATTAFAVTNGSFDVAIMSPPAT